MTESDNRRGTLYLRLETDLEFATRLAPRVGFRTTRRDVDLDDFAWERFQVQRKFIEDGKADR